MKTLPELHSLALPLISKDWSHYSELKAKIDKACNYGVTTNGAHQILRELCEFGFVEIKYEKIKPHNSCNTLFRRAKQ